MKYPKTREIIEYNKIAIDKLKVKKADKHEVKSISKIDETLREAKKEVQIR